MSDPNRNCTTQCDSTFKQNLNKQPHWNPGEMISQEDVAILEKTVQQVPWEVKCCIIDQYAVNISMVTIRQQKKDEVISNETRQSSCSGGKDALTDSSDSSSLGSSTTLASKPCGCDTASLTPSASLSETRQSLHSRRKDAQTDNSNLPSRKTPAHKPSGCDKAGQTPSASEHNSSKTDTLCRWGFSLKDLIEVQQKDEDFTIILDCGQSSIEPDPSILFRSSPAVKYYWLNKEMFCL